MNLTKLKEKWLRKIRNRYVKGAAFFGKHIERTYTLGNISIVLPAMHALPKFQLEHALYDRFLPTLAGALGQTDTIIDVGANCGDSLAAMVAKNPQSNYYCIEPDQRFFKILERNRQTIVQQFPSLQIKLANCLVGNSLKSMHLVGNDTTKRAIVGDGPITTKTLDLLLIENKIENVRLLKIDVDGNDWDVIASATSCIKSNQPLLFFECDFRGDENRQRYKTALDDLAENGYSHWVVFDNFGAVLLRTDDVKVVKQILDYLHLQQLKLTTRTFFYIDVLACSSSDLSLVNRTMEKYQTEVFKV